MTKLGWKPWHQVVALRPDVRTSELSLSQFADDLYDVVMDKETPVYRDPAEFFAPTFPTNNLRELAKDVVHRLAGKNDKTVRQLELTYGGGKTHTLNTLLHPVRDPRGLPDLPAVLEFVQHVGMMPPPTRVASLAFDKLDVEKGIEVKGPAGEARWLRHPWSVLAFQIAGANGLRLLHADGQDAERGIAPAENPGGVIRRKPARFGDPILLDLGGLGIRSIEWAAQGVYLIVAGRHDEGGPSLLFRWSGVSGAASTGGRPLGGPEDFNPEALFRSRDHVVALSDDGTRTSPGHETECKDLEQADQKTFRSLVVPAP